jgi:hypothetical protein
MYANPGAALQALVPFASFKNDNMWDASLLTISKNEDDEYEAALSGFFFGSEEEKAMLRSNDRDIEIKFDPVFEQVYEYLQSHYASVNPKVKWDTLILEVRADGKYQPNYELEGDEVSPDAPPMPETITASYLLQNLQNCLAHNAPDDYKWLYAILERTRAENGNVELGGKFYCSVNDDQSNIQALEPGEYIYMYNVSEQLFDNFFAEKTANWSKVQLTFTATGKYSIKVQKNDFV